MKAIVFYRHQQTDHALVEYNFYDNQFAPSNLVVRKVWMAMLEAVQPALTDLELEYNDHLLLDKWKGRAGEVLRLLGATNETIREHRSGEVVVSRSFRAELTEERYQFFYELKDLSLFPHYRLLAGDSERIVSYFNQYVSVRLYGDEEERFTQILERLHVPYKFR